MEGRKQETHRTRGYTPLTQYSVLLPEERARRKGPLYEETE
jgi:hypothetical protein